MNGGFIFVLLAMFAFLYLVMIRPQRQQQRRHAEMIQGLKAGDEIITVGGLYGDVTGVEDDRVTVEIAEDVEVEVAKRAIASIVPPGAYADEDAEEDEDEAEPVATAAVPEEDSARR